MATRPLGTIKHRSLVYFLLLVSAGLIGIAATVLLRLVLVPLAAHVDQTGFWSDFIRGSLVTISVVPAILSVLAGRRMIGRLWTIVPG